MDVKDILKKRRIELGLTMKEVADKVGVSEGTISRWESGEIANMRRDKIMALANALKISPSVVMGWDEPDEDHNSRPEGQDRPQGRKIPVVADVAAGTPIATWENIIDWEEIEEQADGDYYALRIRGDSMAPVISSGDVVIVRQQPDADTGDIVIAKVNGDESCCKRLIKSKDGITLQSLNPQYLPMFFNAEEIEKSPVRILGKVVELRRKF